MMANLSKDYKNVHISNILEVTFSWLVYLRVKGLVHENNY